MARIRIFKDGKEENNNIEWEKADDITTAKLTIAIKKYNGFPPATIANTMFLIPTVFLLCVLVATAVEALKIPVSESFPLYIIGVFLPGLILSALFINYVKIKPYLYPEKQSTIWIYRTKCFRRETSDRRYTVSPSGYFALFNSKGGQIHIAISQNEYDSNPVGKQYIFYKFNDRIGNPWKVIAADKLDKV